MERNTETRSPPKLTPSDLKVFVYGPDRSTRSRAFDGVKKPRRLVDMFGALVEKFGKRRVLIVGIAAGALVILSTLIIVARSGKPKPAAPKPLEVEVVKVEQRNVPIYSEWIGTTDGTVNADIKAQVEGYLLRRDYQEGDLVKQGQLLFEIDPRPFQAVLDQASGQLAQFEGQLEQAKSQVTQAEAQVGQANSQLVQAQAQLATAKANQLRTQLDENKYGPLLAQNAVTQQDYDNARQTNSAAKAQVDAAQAGVDTARSALRAANAAVGTAKAAVATTQGQVKNAQATIRTAQLNLGFTRITSPVNGIAGIATAQVGDLVNADSGALTAVSTVDPIRVYFTLNEREYLDYTKRNLIDPRPSASASQLELQLILVDGTTYPEKGNFYFADRQVDPKTGAIRAAGVFPNPGNVMRPGQYGRVRAVTNTRENALVVPQRAVSELQGTYQVAVVGPNNKIEIRTVKVGDRVGQSWIIEDGLKAGETVVAEGTQKVATGAVVNPVPYIPAVAPTQ
jgi:membrane fusion protein (multidrug efflux system)